MSASTFRFHADWDFAVPESTPSLVPPCPAVAHDKSWDGAYLRTDVGEAEMQRPVLALPRAARELLFVIDRHAGIDQCMAAVDGAASADAWLLLELGLIQTASSAAAAAGDVGKGRLQPLVDALLALPSYDLYTLLTQQAKRRLGLLQGFRMVLALERCAGHHEQRAMAVRFVHEVWRTHGDAGIVPLQRLLLR